MHTTELNGKHYPVDVTVDNGAGNPWDNEDGHGPVSKWTSRDKRPGERILATERNHRLYYDFGAAVEIAKRDGWGFVGDSKYSTGTRAAASVERDFKVLKGFCDGDWWYVGVVVTDMDTGETASLWGIESDATGYIESVAQALSMDLLEAEQRRVFPVSSMGV